MSPKLMKVIVKLKKVDLLNDNFFKLYFFVLLRLKPLTIFNMLSLSISDFYLKFLICYIHVIQKKMIVLHFSVKYLLISMHIMVFQIF